MTLHSSLYRPPNPHRRTVAIAAVVFVVAVLGTLAVVAMVTGGASSCGP